MKQPDTLAKWGATPAKLAVAALLLFVWIAILLAQFGPGKSANVQSGARKATAGARPRSAAARTRSAGSPNESMTARRGPHRVWPEISLQEIQSHDPFKLPKALAPPPKLPVPGSDALAKSAQEQSQNRRQHRLADLQQEGVQLVLLSEHGQFAKIGGRHLRVGDYVDGFKVTEIRADGVVLVEHDEE